MVQLLWRIHPTPMEPGADAGADVRVLRLQDRRVERRRFLCHLAQVSPHTLPVSVSLSLSLSLSLCLSPLSLSLSLSSLSLSALSLSFSMASGSTALSLPSGASLPRHSTPYTLQPTPYTLHPTLYTLYRSFGLNTSSKGQTSPFRKKDPQKSPASFRAPALSFALSATHRCHLCLRV